MVEDLLRILPEGIPPTVSQRDHGDTINGHTFLLAQTTEAIRRELMPLAILTSNYTNKARKAHANLQILTGIWAPLLDKRSLKKVARNAIEVDDTSAAIKEEPTDDLSDAQQLFGSVTTRPTQIRRIWRSMGFYRSKDTVIRSREKSSAIFAMLMKDQATKSKLSLSQLCRKSRHFLQNIIIYL